MKFLERTLALVSQYGRPPTAPTMNSNGAISSEERNFVDNLQNAAAYYGIPLSLGGYHTTDPHHALKFSIVYACVRLIAGSISQMPIQFYGEEADGRKRREYGDLEYLLNVEPHPRWTGASFMEYMVRSVLLRGDGYAYINRDNGNNPLQIMPLDPSAVEAQAGPDGGLIYNLRGMVSNAPGDTSVSIRIPQEDMLHFPGAIFDGVKSMSVLQTGAYHALASKAAADFYAQDFFTNGLQSPIALSSDEDWSEADQARVAKHIQSKNAAGTASRSLPLMLRKATVQKLDISAEDAELLESRDYATSDVARAFGCASFLVNQESKTTAWGTGISEFSLSFNRFTLGPIIRRFELEMRRKLSPNREVICRIDTSGLERATPTERMTLARNAVGGSQGPGILSVNEIRVAEGYDPWPEAVYDRGFMPDMGRPEPTGEENGQEAA